MAWLSQSPAAPWRPEYNHSPIHMGFEVNKLALEQAFLQTLQFSPVTNTPSVFSNLHSLITDAI